MVSCIITIDSKEFEGNFSIEITQHTNSHDFFTVTTPDDNFDSFHGYIMEQSKYLTGKEITVSFWRYGKSRQSFSGREDLINKDDIPITETKRKGSFLPDEDDVKPKKKIILRPPEK